MIDSSEMKSAIQQVIIDLMDRVIEKVLHEDPFLPEVFQAKAPLYAALVPDEIFKGSHFERRFVTPFGNVWEKLAVVAATKGLGFGTKGYRIEGVIREGRLSRISEVLSLLEHSSRGREKKKPDWDIELNYILEGQGELVPVVVDCDVYAEDKINNLKFAFELKSPLPNSDQTKVSKEKLFKLYSMEKPQIDGAFFALPYNPYGKKEDYAWSFPKRWFDMCTDEVVLIGTEFWEKVGGQGTYKAFIDAVNEIGSEYKEIIYRNYLGIEPPKDALDDKLK